MEKKCSERFCRMPVTGCFEYISQNCKITSRLSFPSLRFPTEEYKAFHKNHSVQAKLRIVQVSSVRNDIHKSDLDFLKRFASIS